MIFFAKKFGNHVNIYMFLLFLRKSYLGYSLGLVWFYDISTIVGYLMPNPLCTHILNIQDLVWLGLWHINNCRLFNAKSPLYIHGKYVGFYLAWFYGISIIVGYLMQNPLYTYILNIYDLVWLGFMAYQPLQVI